MNTTKRGRAPVGGPPLLDWRLKYRPVRLEEFWNYPRDKSLRLLAATIATSVVEQLVILYGLVGCGKTSLAQLLGMWASCQKWRDHVQPCGSCAACRVVRFGTDSWRCGLFELDGSSDRLWPELNEAGQHACTSTKGTISDPFTDNPRPTFIFVDEAHRIRKDVQEKLQTVIEKWQHVRFVFATTNPDRLDRGLWSRGGKYPLSYPSPEEASVNLVRIARQEQVELLEQDAMVIARRLNGSPRDCVGAIYRLKSLGPKCDRATIEMVLPDEVGAVVEARRDEMHEF